MNIANESLNDSTNSKKIFRAIPVALVLFFCFATVQAEAFKESPPPIPKNAPRPDLEKMIDPYNRGDFPRTDTMLRLDYFYSDLNGSVDDVAKWAYEQMKIYEGRFFVEFHFVFDEHTKPGYRGEMPYLMKFGAKPDFNGVLAKRARVKTYPAARFAYRDVVWVLPGHEVKNSANALISKLKIRPAPK